MKITFYSTMLFLLLPPTIFCQIIIKPYFGVSINVNYMREKAGTSSTSELLPPPDLYLHLGSSFNGDIKTELYLGFISFADNWDGLDLGLTLKYEIINKTLLLAGLGFNSTSGGDNLPGNNTPVFYQKDFTYLNFGLQRNLSKNVFLEFLYSQPLNGDKKYGESSYPHIAYYFKLMGKLKIGIGYHFDL